MAESSTFLLPSFSQPSPTSSGEKKENTIQRALTSSVSFGRFMSESLDWEKWSAFTHNRNLEEVERYSRPGSVAEKKAYFEAHFKRRRAQALLEQQSALTETNETPSSDASMDLESAQVDGHATTAHKDEDVNGQNSETVASVNDPLVEKMSKDSLPQEIEQGTEPSTGDSTDCPIENDGSMCNSSAVTKEYNASNEGEKESEVSLAVSERKPQVPPRLLKATGHGKDNSKQQNNKKRSNPTSSLHMSMIGFASSSLGEVQKTSCSGRSKLEYLRNARPRVKANKSIMLPRIFAEASSENERFKPPSATPLQQNRTKIPCGDSITGTRMVFGKVQSPSTTSNSFRSPTTFGKAQSPTVPASFTFRSEERAEKRKEFFQKLESKFKSKDEEKQKLEQKLKARNAAHCSAASKVMEIAGNRQVTETTCNVIKKISPKLQERIAALKVHDNNSKPPWRLAGKTDGSKGSSIKGRNNDLPPLYNSTKLSSKKDMCENASPNIQSRIDH